MQYREIKEYFKGRFSLPLFKKYSEHTAYLYLTELIGFGEETEQISSTSKSCLSLKVDKILKSPDDLQCTLLKRAIHKHTADWNIYTRSSRSNNKLNLAFPNSMDNISWCKVNI